MSSNPSLWLYPNGLENNAKPNRILNVKPSGARDVRRKSYKRGSATCSKAMKSPPPRFHFYSALVRHGPTLSYIRGMHTCRLLLGADGRS